MDVRLHGVEEDGCDEVLRCRRLGGNEDFGGGEGCVGGPGGWVSKVEKGGPGGKSGEHFEGLGEGTRFVAR